MSITYKGARNGDIERDSSGLLQVKRTLLFYFNAGESNVACLRMPQIPAPGAVHPDLAYLTCSSLSLKAKGIMAGTYEAECTYTQSSANLSANGSSGEAPWQQGIVKWSAGSSETVVALQRAYDEYGDLKVPVVSSSGTPIAAQTVERNRLIRFTYYLQDFDSNWITEFSGRLNAFYVKVGGVDIPAKAGLLKSLVGNMLTTYDDKGDLKWKYYEVNVEVEISDKDEGFKYQPLDKSCWFIDRNEEGEKLCRIYTDNHGAFGSERDMNAILRASYASEYAKGARAVPVDEEMPLDGEGGILVPGPDVELKYLSFNQYKAISWSALSIPESR